MKNVSKHKLSQMGINLALALSLVEIKPPTNDFIPRPSVTCVADISHSMWTTWCCRPCNHGRIVYISRGIINFVINVKFEKNVFDILK